MFDVRGGAGQQHSPCPARGQGFDAAMPCRLGSRRSFDKVLALGKEFGQFVILLPRARRAAVELLEQIGAIVASQHGRPQRHGQRCLPPASGGNLQQLERIAPGQLTIARVVRRQRHQPVPLGKGAQQGRRIDHRVAAQRQRFGGDQFGAGCLGDRKRGAAAGFPFAADLTNRLGQRGIIGHDQLDLHIASRRRLGRGCGIRPRPAATGCRNQQQHEPNDSMERPTLHEISRVIRPAAEKTRPRSAW